MFSSLSKTTAIHKYIIFALSISYAVIVLFPNFTAQWGLIDDHGIVTVLGPEHKLHLSHVPQVIANVPEIGDIGKYPRFQPVYILFHLAEAFCWGGNPLYFYTFRVLLFGLTIGLFTVLFSEMFGLWGGSILGTAFAAHQFWGDVCARLGPAEIYAAPLLAIYCFAFWRLWSACSRRTFWYIVLTLSGICLLGTKENLIFIVPAAIILAFHNWRQKSLRPYQILLNGSLVAFGFFVIWAVMAGLHANGGKDFYGTPVNAIYRLKMMLAAIASLTNWKIEPPILIPFVISNILFWLSLTKNKMGVLFPFETVRTLWYEQISLFLLWCLQVVFYFKRNIPQGEHYDFPGILFVDVAYFLLVVVFINAFSNWRVYRGKTNNNLVVNFFLIILAALMLFGRARDVEQIYRKAQINSEVTRRFTKKLKYIVNEAARFPKAPIVIESHWVWDFEPIGGLRRYLSVYGVKNPLVVKIVGYSVKTVQPGHQRVLAKKMTKRSLYGDFNTYDGLAPKGTIMLPYYPLSILKPGGNCFVVSFSGDSSLDCKRLGRIYF